MPFMEGSLCFHIAYHDDRQLISLFCYHLMEYVTSFACLQNVGKVCTCADARMMHLPAFFSILGNALLQHAVFRPVHHFGAIVLSQQLCHTGKFLVIIERCTSSFHRVVESLVMIPLG